ncbi:MAG: GNAT family N-acetyltransferase [Treponemataceae bacterium]|nr:GNAT family N-acetyltransferase [Treponemataceae bacterium]
MELKTARLVLRPWNESDAGNLYKYASDPLVGPPAGWPPHKSASESLEVIRTVFCGTECYAVCLAQSEFPAAGGTVRADCNEAPRAVGCVELKLNGRTDMTERDDECEFGCWIARPFWGRGLIPEAARELLRRAFEDLGMRAVWYGWYDGNEQSRRVQEKLGFDFHHTCPACPVPLLGETRISHTSVLTRERWLELNAQIDKY